jgi:hypothetical protein
LATERAVMLGCVESACRLCVFALNTFSMICNAPDSRNASAAIGTRLRFGADSCKQYQIAASDRYVFSFCEVVSGCKSI